MNIYKFWNIFTNVLLILLIIFNVYLFANNFLLDKITDIGNYDYSYKAKNFDGEYVKEYGYINTAQHIVDIYVQALKVDNNKLANLLIKDIQKDESIYITISNNIGNDVYIKEVKLNDDKDEILIKYSTLEDESDTNIMLCKLNTVDGTFIICYDSLLEGV